ncbi:MFS transporter [Herbaspirillum sp. meg3]|uniref:MFS transporter n=1 Tax=Herbaspirillum sp. meg3 TaxID=2025949 RepID=UPI001E49B456|nr:MFS transporter [Herbaspirillum sp. meg3]
MNPTTNDAAGYHAGAADSVYARIALRFLPLLFVCYVMAYLDRVNVGFAKLQMLNDLQLSETVYGLGAGVFFLGYFIFEVPSNLLLHKIGARRWIARIMITWSILSMCTAWVSTPLQLYVVRFLLGIAEAGFYPGMLLYLTYWFPAHRRGRMVALLTAGNPVSGMLGGPLSGFLMTSMAGVGGMYGWQWLFILEALPGILLGIVVFRHLNDRVADAGWLSAEERAMVQRDIDMDNTSRTHASIGATFKSGRVWLLALILFCIIMGSYALSFWQPTIIKGTGITNPTLIGILTIIPYTAALLSMILMGRSADKHRERRWHVIVPALFAACGFVVCANTAHSAVLSVVGLTMVAMGVVSALPMFWALPTSFLGGAGAAAGIALINSTANLAGFISPTVIGALKSMTGTLSSGLYLVAGTLTLAALLIWAFIPARLVNR